ncbi:MAG: hypothetical protein K2N12_02415 [Helicobacter sp.]|nr:hypothetical protein [Helicobacter sp.]
MFNMTRVSNSLRVSGASMAINEQRIPTRSIASGKPSQWRDISLALNITIGIFGGAESSALKVCATEVAPPILPLPINFDSPTTASMAINHIRQP